jgi:hypothetical protein
MPWPVHSEGREIVGRELVRMIRVLEYVGPRKWIDDCLHRRSVKGSYLVVGKCIIREGLIGEFPMALTPEERVTYQPPHRSYCKRHDMYPGDDAPCWKCVQEEIDKMREDHTWVKHVKGEKKDAE